MEIQQSRPSKSVMSFDDAFMDRSSAFVMALQELKNLRPQLYSAAEYCESSYLHSEKKQIVLDNLKDYAVQSLVNIVDHLGTVAFKLTHFLEQQTLSVSTLDVKVIYLNQKLLTSQTYTDKEGLRQQQLLAFIPSHHKHYILPNSVNKKVHFSPHIEAMSRQSYSQAIPRIDPSESSPTQIGDHSPTSASSTQTTMKSRSAFHLLDPEEAKSSTSHLHSQNGFSASGSTKQGFGLTQKGLVSSDAKHLGSWKSMESSSHGKHSIIPRSPLITKTMLCALFAKYKVGKVKNMGHLSTK